MREADSKRLVIDTDVAQAAGSETATHPRAKHCRDFLQEVWGKPLFTFDVPANRFLFQCGAQRIEDFCI